MCHKARALLILCLIISTWSGPVSSCGSLLPTVGGDVSWKQFWWTWTFPVGTGQLILCHAVNILNWFRCFVKWCWLSCTGVHFVPLSCLSLCFIDVNSLPLYLKSKELHCFLVFVLLSPGCAGSYLMIISSLLWLVASLQRSVSVWLLLMTVLGSEKVAGLLDPSFLLVEAVTWHWLSKDVS